MKLLGGYLPTKSRKEGELLISINAGFRVVSCLRPHIPKTMNVSAMDIALYFFLFFSFFFVILSKKKKQKKRLKLCLKKILQVIRPTFSGLAKTLSLQCSYSLAGKKFLLFFVKFLKFLLFFSQNIVNCEKILMYCSISLTKVGFNTLDLS